MVFKTQGCFINHNRPLFSPIYFPFKKALTKGQEPLKKALKKGQGALKKDRRPKNRSLSFVRPLLKRALYFLKGCLRDSYPCSIIFKGKDKAFLSDPYYSPLNEGIRSLKQRIGSLEKGQEAFNKTIGSLKNGQDALNKIQ